MTQAYRLQLSAYSYVITGDEWRGLEQTGLAIIYPEHDLLWLCRSDDEKTQRFKTFEDFEKEFNALPRWEATRYAFAEGAILDGEDGRIIGYELFPFDCRTGKLLPDQSRERRRLARVAAELTRGEMGIY
jgi:hypothetical protein